MSWSHRLLVLWMAAAAVHLPVPVGDGDNLKSGESLVAGAAHSTCWDIDFVLLGCDPPDDCDDGPIDDDPENGSGSPLGSYLVHVQCKSPDASGAMTAVATGACVAHWTVRGAGCLSKPQCSGSLPRQIFSFGKACQSGVAVMRC